MILQWPERSRPVTHYRKKGNGASADENGDSNRTYPDSLDYSVSYREIEQGSYRDPMGELKQPARR